MDRSRRRAFAGIALFALAGLACGGPDATDPLITDTRFDLRSLGQGEVAERFTGELWVHGNTAYTTTWSTRTVGSKSVPGNAIKVWDISVDRPVLVDSLIVADARTIGDVQVTADGRYLVAAVEGSPLVSLVIYRLEDPRRPSLMIRYTSPETITGVHTAEVQSVGGRLYAFLSVNPAGATVRAKLVILDITDPANPAAVFSQQMGDPLLHDVFVRDGILMTALWNDGIGIWDIGGGGRGGTISAPVLLSTTGTRNGSAHNIFWFRDAASGRSYAIVGEEGPASIPTMSSGDVHVMDVSDFSAPREVAFLNIPGAGVHNFSADESRGILYMAYYNAGVQAIDIRGDLGACPDAQRDAFGRCDLAKMDRLLAKGPVGFAGPIFMWGVHFAGGRLYASDMVNGLWKLSTVPAS